MRRSVRRGMAGRNRNWIRTYRSLYEMLLRDAKFDALEPCLGLKHDPFMMQRKIKHRPCQSATANHGKKDDRVVAMLMLHLHPI